MVEIIVKNGTKEVKTVIIKKDDQVHTFRGSEAKKIANIINTNQHTLKNLVEAL
jgi:hypothetical protein